MRRNLRSLRDLKDIFNGSAALVLATGPSALSLDWREVRTFRTEGNSLITVNSYYKLPYSQDLIPDYYVLTDPYFFPISAAFSKSGNLHSYLKDHSEIKVVVPAHVETSEVDLPNEIIYINTLSLEGFSRNISPLKARGYLGLTAFSALAFAQFLGFSRILILGIDNTPFRALTIDAEGLPVLKANHAYDDGNEVVNFNGALSDLESALFFYARHFSDLGLFDRNRIFNLDERTIIRNFKIISFAQLSDYSDE